MPYEAIAAKIPGWFFGIVSDNAFRYLLFAGLAWLFGYVVFRSRWLVRKINPRWPDRAQMWREFGYSALTVVVYGAVGAVSIVFIARGYGQMYYRIARYGEEWFLVSIVLTIILHDAYFYWTHRAMHHPRLFRWFHAVHHRSKNPTPWSTYAFAPLEAAVQAGIFPLTVLLIPIHPVAFLIFSFWQIAWSVLGHAGFEIYPRWWLKSWLGKIFNTPTNHILHHEYFHGNYGLYFNYWDRLMGTNHREYERRFEEVTSRGQIDTIEGGIQDERISVC